MADVADESGEAPDMLLLRLLDETALDIGFTFHFGNEADVQAIIQHPAHMGSTDAIMMGSSPHPRAYGTYPRYLGHYTRELGLFTLEDAIRRFTGFPAQRFGLHDRGIIRNGMALTSWSSIRLPSSTVLPSMTPVSSPWELSTCS